MFNIIKLIAKLKKKTLFIILKDMLYCLRKFFTKFELQKLNLILITVYFKVSIFS